MRVCVIFQVFYSKQLNGNGILQRLRSITSATRKTHGAT